MKRTLFHFISISICIFALTSQSFGADLESRIQAMEAMLKKQQQTIEEQQRTIEVLESRIGGRTMTGTEKTAEEAPRPERIGKIRLQGEPGAVTETAPAAEAKKPSGITGLFGGSALSNPNISLVLNTFAYSSNLKNEALDSRGIPGYTTEGIERKNGFNLESAELFLFAPVDPYFNLYATIPVTEHSATVEEAYFTTTLLPEGNQIKGGKFKSGFGRINAQHPHAWDFVDIPLPYRAFTGPEGIIEKGVQYTYIPKWPFYTIFGAEVLQGENTTLFGENATGGPHAFTGFAKASFDIGEHSTLLFGPSVITGKTKTDTVRADSDLTADSTLYGVEFVYKWKPSGQQSFTLQSEYMYRDQYGDLTDTALGAVERLDRSQDGVYVQGIYQWDRWRFGARYDALNIFKENYSLAGSRQDFGRNPWRASGMIEFNPTEFSRLRFQYTNDQSDPMGRTNHEFFVQLILGIGAHAAHPF
jgi:hypothetical protein